MLTRYFERAKSKSGLQSKSEKFKIEKGKSQVCVLNTFSDCFSQMLLAKKAEEYCFQFLLTGKDTPNVGYLMITNTLPL